MQTAIHYDVEVRSGHIEHCLYAVVLSSICVLVWKLVVLHRTQQRSLLSPDAGFDVHVLDLLYKLVYLCARLGQDLVSAHPRDLWMFVYVSTESLCRTLLA